MTPPEPNPCPEIPGWLQELAYIPNRTFPIDELRDLWDRGAEVEQPLLDYLKWLASPGQPGWTAVESDNWLHFIAIFLLTDRGCRDVFEPLAEIAADEEYAELLLGDAVTEDLPGWLRVSGTPGQLRNIVKDPTAQIWLRTAALTALGGLAWENKGLSREEHREYLAELPTVLSRQASLIWDEWVVQAAYFRCKELRDIVADLEKREAFELGEGVESFDGLIADPDVDAMAERNFFYSCPGGDAGLYRFATYACFQPDFIDDMVTDADLFDESYANAFPEEFDAPQPYVPIGTVVREGPKIQRNDPCPCGSGKKWKKCCGK